MANVLSSRAFEAISTRDELLLKQIESECEKYPQKLNKTSSACR